MQSLFQEYVAQISQYYIQIGMFDEKDNFCLSEQDQKIIYKTFDKFYLNKLVNSKIRKVKLEVKKPNFRPKLNPVSNLLYKKKRERLEKEKRVRAG